MFVSALTPRVETGILYGLPRLSMQKPNDTVGISGSVSRSVDSATDSVHKAINTASEKSHPAVDQMVSGAHNAADSIAGAANTAAAAIDHKSEQFMDAQAKFLEDCREFVHDKPLTALGIAIGAGYLMHWWLRRS
jgi:ElaB/YqjD/DUF883 family membrane-anchored ribosome-binding protein